MCLWQCCVLKTCMCVRVTMLCESRVCVCVRVVHDNVVCVKVCDNAVSLQNSCV